MCKLSNVAVTLAVEWQQRQRSRRPCQQEQTRSIAKRAVRGGVDEEEKGVKKRRARGAAASRQPRSKESSCRLSPSQSGISSADGGGVGVVLVLSAVAKHNLSSLG